MIIKKFHKIISFIVINIIIVCGCHFKSNAASDKINSYLSSFAQSIEKQPDKFEKIVDPEGFVLVRTYLSGYGYRGKEVYEKIKPSDIPGNLEFNLVKGEQGQHFWKFSDDPTFAKDSF